MYYYAYVIMSIMVKETLTVNIAKERFGLFGLSRLDRFKTAI